MPICGVETLVGLALDDLATLCEAAARTRPRLLGGCAPDPIAGGGPGGPPPEGGDTIAP